MHVYILCTLDTKGYEAAFVRDRLRALGVSAKLVDVGCMGHPLVEPDIARDEVFRQAGSRAEEVCLQADRGHAVSIADTGATKLILEFHSRRDVAGVLGLGGSAGTLIGTGAMRALPIGTPKVMVSSLASGQTRQYVGDKDIFMLNAVVDIAGLNRVSRRVLDQAARAMAGLVKFAQDGLRNPTESSFEHVPSNARDASQPAGQSSEAPTIALTMFGVTTPCVEHARRVIEAAGYEALVFHATGAGGRAMESLIREGLICGVLDLTTTELADEIVGGYLTAGPARLTGAAAVGVPQVVSVGATDMVNFHAPETVPARFGNRLFHCHDPQVTLMRTTPEESTLIGANIGRKVAEARGPVAVMLPRRGVSRLDAKDKPFDDPQARLALFAAVRAHAGCVEVIELDMHINDSAFAEAAAHKLLKLMGVTIRES